MTQSHLSLVQKGERQSHRRGVSGAQRRYNSQSMVRDISAYDTYPFVALTPNVYDDLQAICAKATKPASSNIRVLIRLLECFLCVSGQRLILKNGRLWPQRILLDFGGALYSERFLEAKPMRRYQFLDALRFITDQTGTIESESFPKIRTAGATPAWAALKRKFDEAILEQEQVSIWRGWPVLGKVNCHWLDLRLLHIRYGTEFALIFQGAMQRYYEGRRATKIPGTKQFINYLSGLPNQWVRSDFYVPARTAELFSQFALHYVKLEGQRRDYSHIALSWASFTHFLCEAAFPQRLMAAPLWGLPDIPLRGASSRPTHHKRNAAGAAVSAKLITDVPLELTDEEATDIIFNRIEYDLEQVRAWANHYVDEVWTRYLNFERLAGEGEVRLIGKSNDPITAGWTTRNHPRWRENVATTFKDRGFAVTAKDGNTSLIYGKPLEDVYPLLALPTSGALLPHMAILVLEHPLITSSFLEKLELYDKDAQISAISQTDSAWILEGYKLRKGPDTAQQTITLTPRAKDVLMQVIKITQPLRTYLHAHNDANWRRLFLQCGRGFSSPRPLTISKDIYSNFVRLKEQFSNFHPGPEAELERFVRRFSLATLRAQKVVASYIKNQDVAQISRDLGHEKTDFSQIGRYIPAPLLAFFQERWVRMFQSAILLDCLKDSPYRLQSTGFKSMEQVHRFLKNHALSIKHVSSAAMHEKSSFGALPNADGKVVFGVSAASLTVLESMRLAVRESSSGSIPLAIEWANFSERLVEYIQNTKPIREDLVVMLEEAQRAADPTPYREVVRVHR